MEFSFFLLKYFKLLVVFAGYDNMEHRKGKKHCQWQPGDMEEALEACRERGMSASKASREFSVPRRTLADRLSKKVKDSVRGAGNCTFLTAEQEQVLCNYISLMAQRAFPLTIQQILSYAWCIDKKSGRNKFGPNGPSETWWKGFKGRHPEAVKLRKPDSLDRGRAIYGTVNALRHYFQILKSALEEGGFCHRPQDIYNCDETVVEMNKWSQKVVVPRRMRTSHSRLVATSEHISIHCCVSAAGSTIPPFIIFKDAFPGGNYTAGGPDGALYGRQQSGFMDGELFLKWLRNLFVPNAKPTADKPVLLLVDGHSSHCTFNVIEAARDANVILLALAPHTTHLCQPLDVAVYKAFKVQLSKLMRLGQTLRGDFWVTKTNVPKMIRGPFEQSMTIQNIKSGFRKCGIHPFDPNAIDRSQLFRNHLIPREDVNLSIPPADADAGTDAEPDTALQKAETVAVNPSSPDNNLQSNRSPTQPDHATEDEDPLNFQFVGEVNPLQSEEPPVINISDEPGVRRVPLDMVKEKRVIKVTTGLQKTAATYESGPGESIEVFAQDTCTCGAVQGTSKPTRHPLVDAGIISPELASVFAPSEEYIPPGRKRPLRVKSRARIMTSDDVYSDMKKQREEVEDKERATAEKKATLEKKRGTTSGKASTSNSKASTSSDKDSANSGKVSTSNRGRIAKKRSVQNVSCDEEESLCITCGTNYYSQRRRKQGKWAGCDNCDSWFCEECLPDDFNYNASFTCDNC